MAIEKPVGILEVISANLSDLISRPDPEAAIWLNQRMYAWMRIDKLHERSFVERGIITRQFETRELWKHVIDPETDLPFPNLTAWLSCDAFLGCRRTNFESKRKLALLEDVPYISLIDVPKHNLDTLIQLSTAVRNDPEVLEAAKYMEREEFEAKIELDHPHQHIESRASVKFNIGRSGRKVMESWISYALEHDIAGSREEAIVRACELALHDVELDDELAAMPENPISAAIGSWPGTETDSELLTALKDIR